jgi:peptide/nickel transport system substrate-binding protein
MLVALGIGMLIIALGMPPGAHGGAPIRLPDIEHPKVLTSGKIGRYGGTLIAGEISDPRTFNSIVSQETSSTVPLGRVFDGLVETNYDTTDVEPALAESWTTSPDGKTWTFKLRKGVRFHDGVELTADDVIFNMDTAFTPGVRGGRRDVLTFAGKPVAWRKVDTYTVEFRTEEPFGPFLRTIGFNVLPKHKLEAAVKAGAAEFNKTWGVNTPPREIVGTGPFIMQTYVPGERIVFLRNPTYWKVDANGNRLPYLARHVQMIVPNFDTLRLKFQAGETDLYGVRPREFAEFKAGEKSGKYTVYEAGPTAGTEFLMFNQNPRAVTPPRLTWFTSTKFRQAISYAVDRTAVANQIYGGRATPLFGPITLANKVFFNAQVKPYPHDVGRAEALLAEAGFKKGPDGALRDASGNVLEFTLSTNAENSERVAIANLIRQDLTKLGIKVTLAPEAFNTLVGKLDAGANVDALIWGFTGGIDPHTGQNIWRSSGSLHRWNPKQEKPATSWEAEIDRLFDQAATTLDQNRRKRLYNRWQEIVAEQQPLIYLVNTLTSSAARNTLANIRPSGFAGSTWNIEQIFYTVPFR